MFSSEPLGSTEKITPTRHEGIPELELGRGLALTDVVGLRKTRESLPAQLGVEPIACPTFRPRQLRLWTPAQMAWPLLYVIRL